MNTDTKKLKIDSRKIAITAIYIAILLVMNWTPYFGYIPPMPPLTTAKITFLLIPVILAAQNDGLFTGVVTSTAFGILSFLSAVINAPIFGLGPFLVNPMVSIFPRICIGFTVFFTFKALKKYNFFLAAIVSTVVGVVTNTALVITMLLVFHGSAAVSLSAGGEQAMTIYALGLISVNFLIELVLCIVVVPAASFALHKARKMPTYIKPPKK